MDYLEYVLIIVKRKFVDLSLLPSNLGHKDTSQKKNIKHLKIFCIYLFLYTENSSYENLTQFGVTPRLS